MDDNFLNPSLYDLFNGAMLLFVKIGLVILIASAIGALIAGIFRAVTQIEDPVISLFGKVSCLLIVLYLSFSSFAGDISNFAGQIWGDVSYYH